MFTGLIEEIGNVKSITGLGADKRIAVECKLVLDGISIGDSISIDGACLTVTSFDKTSFTADISAETLSRSTLGLVKPGARVNLERALQPGDRMGGHMVLGHVDCVGKILRFDVSGDGGILGIEVPSEYAAFIASKGSIAVDGISLTPVDVTGDEFSVAVIPTTLRETSLQDKKPGDMVNIEVDIIARYVKRILETGKSGEGLTISKLIEEGFV
jgi:riboflavin synthase